MRVIPVSEEYRGVKSDSNIYRMLVKYRGIPCGGIDGQYSVDMAQFEFGFTV